jgi:hypothetical protein
LTSSNTISGEAGAVLGPADGVVQVLIIKRIISQFYPRFFLDAILISKIPHKSRG